MKPATIMNLAIMDMSPGTKTPKRFCGVGPYMKSYDVDGQAYPCHAFAPLCLGKDLSKKAQNLDFTCPLELKDLDEKCRECPVVGVCPTCYGINFGNSENIYHIENDHCKMMKVKMIEKRQNGVCLFELQNDEIKVITSNLGCHILSVFTKDRDGNYGCLLYTSRCVSETVRS